MSYESYNHSTLTIKSDKADSLAVKGNQTAVQLYDFIDGVAEINTDEYAVGDYLIQFFKGDEVIEQTTLKVKQNLKYVDANYDPRSKAEITLQAIEAYLAGRASSQQKEVSVGDKRIVYSSFDQLIKWRQFYKKEVRKEAGKAPALRFEKLSYKGV